MKPAHRLALGAIMTVALAFGFLHLLVADPPHDLDRLHVFLFNLCAGGAILVHYGRGIGPVRPSEYLYLALTLAYAISAFFEHYLVPILLSVPLIALVESVRIRRFGSFFPWRFFRAGEVSDKFLEAALLCLSMATGAAAVVMLNNEHLHLFYLEKLTLDVFFLGYSFPLSLLTMSVMFSFVAGSRNRLERALREVGFWSITVGVVTFFVFIIFELTVAEVVISNLLLAAVCLVFWLFVRSGGHGQQRTILASGMGFLVLTGVTGVGYLVKYVYPPFDAIRDSFLVWHATIALYGWNLSGLFIVVRWSDFPIGGRIGWIVALHWLTVLLLAPLGKYLLPVAAVALPAYALLLWVVFLGRGSRRAEAR